MNSIKGIILYLFSTLILSSSLFSQDVVVSRVIELASKDNKTMHHLDILTNRIGGRLAGSDAYTTATYWVADLLKKWGLEVEITEVGEVPVGFNRGPWFGKMIGKEGFTLHFVTPSYTSGTKGVQRGHVVLEPKNREEFNKIKGKLKGAWVLITGNSDGYPIDHSEYADTIRSIIIKENEETKRYNDSIILRNRNLEKSKQQPLKEYRDAPALFYREMVEAGILGIIQSAPLPLAALYDRKNMEYLEFDALPECPDIKLNEHQFKIIEQKAKEREYFLLEFDIRNHFKPGPIKIHNVIGYIRGSSHPEELVMSRSLFKCLIHGGRNC